LKNRVGPVSCIVNIENTDYMEAYKENLLYDQERENVNEKRGDDQKTISRKHTSNRHRRQTSDSKSAKCLRDHREHSQQVDPVNNYQDDRVNHVPLNRRLCARRIVCAASEVHAKQLHTCQHRTHTIGRCCFRSGCHVVNVAIFDVNHFQLFCHLQQLTSNTETFQFHSFSEIKVEIAPFTAGALGLMLIPLSGQSARM